MGAAGSGHKYTVRSWDRHLVSEYTGLSFLEVAELDYIQFLVWRRDAFIQRMSRTEEGQKFLDNAWRMEQTSADRAGLRKFKEGR